MKKSEVSIVVTVVWVFLCVLGGAAAFISVVGKSDIPRSNPTRGMMDLTISGITFSLGAGFVGFVLLRLVRHFFRRRRKGSQLHRHPHAPYRHRR
jgi:hypothetical protein